MKNQFWRITLGVVLAALVVWGLVILVSSGIWGLVIATLILWVLATAGILVVRQIGLKWLIVWFGEQDKWWSPVRMKPGPGHIVMMTKGREPGGPFAMLLAGHIPYWHYHESDKRFYKEDDPDFGTKFPDGLPAPKGWLGEMLDDAGVIWVGFVRRYYRRKRRWEAWDLKPGKTEYGIVRKETKPEEEHIFYFATTIAIDLETIPTKDNYPAQMKLVENVLLIHPEKAEFVAGKWETQAVAATRARAREYIAGKTVEELKVERDTDNKQEFVDYILVANSTAATIRLVPDYGVMIQGPYYVDFDLESGDLEMTAAMKRQMIASEDIKTAKLRAQEKTELGKGDANRRTEEAHGIRETIAAWGSNPVGGTVAMAEAIKEAKPKAIGGGIIAGIDVEK